MTTVIRRAVPVIFVIEEAIKNISDMTSIKVQLGRLGNTFYTLGEVNGTLDKNIMIPSSVLNKCRRELVADILEKRQAKEQRSFDQYRFAQVIRDNMPKQEKKRKANNLGLSVIVADTDQALVAAKRSDCDIYYDCAGISGARETDFQQIFEIAAKSKARVIPYFRRSSCLLSKINGRG